jgi:hypothetical protein
MELVCSQGRELERSASYCDRRRTLEAGGIASVIRFDQWCL